jgi:hypothetical protein
MKFTASLRQTAARHPSITLPAERDKHLPDAALRIP